jgi:hypothetical protein
MAARDVLYDSVSTVSPSETQNPSNFEITRVPFCLPVAKRCAVGSEFKWVNERYGDVSPTELVQLRQRIDVKFSRLKRGVV